VVCNIKETVQSKTLNHINAEWLEDRKRDPSTPAVLLAEDSEADVFFLLRAFSTAGVKNPVHVVRSGAEAIDYLAGNGKFADRARFPTPKIVFVDLKMPHVDGFEVLRWKQDRHLDGILWVAVSNFDSVKTINEAYKAGATTFLTKPLDATDIRNLIEAFDEFYVAKLPANRLP
jgi:CheY-like chemotaxis protein